MIVLPSAWEVIPCIMLDVLILIQQLRVYDANGMHTRASMGKQVNIRIYRYLLRKE